MGNVIAAQQTNGEFWNDPQNPTVFGKFIEDTLKDEGILQARQRACCLGQVGRDDAHSGLKLSIANIGVTEDGAYGGGIVDNGPKTSVAATESSLGLNMPDGVHNQLFYKANDYTTDGKVNAFVANETDRNYFKHPTNPYVKSEGVSTFVGSRAESFTGGLNDTRREKHVFTDGDFDGEYSNNRGYYTALFNEPYETYKYQGDTEDAEDAEPIVSSAFLKANALPTKRAGDDTKILSNVTAALRVSRLPAAFHPDGFVVKKVGFRNDKKTEKYCNDNEFDVKTDTGRYNCDESYKNFCASKIEHRSDTDIACVKNDGSLDETDPACLVKNGQPGIFADDLGRTALFTYPEDCSCLNSQDSGLMHASDGPLGAPLASLMRDVSVDSHTAVPHADAANRHPLKTDKFCKDRATLDYKLVNAANQEYTQPAYVLSEDRAAFGVEVDYALPAATDTSNAPPAPQGQDQGQDPGQDQGQDPDRDPDPGPGRGQDGAAASTSYATAPTYDTDGYADGDEPGEDTKGFFEKYKMWLIACAVVLCLAIIAMVLMPGGSGQGANMYYY